MGQIKYQKTTFFFFRRKKRYFFPVSEGLNYKMAKKRMHVENGKWRGVVKMLGRGDGEETQLILLKIFLVIIRFFYSFRRSRL